MFSHLRTVLLRNIGSPYSLALLSYLIFALAWTFPPSLYTHYLNEPDLMYLDLTTLGFYTLCTAAFFLGVRTVRFSWRRRNNTDERKICASNTLLFLCLPIALATLACSVYLILLGGSINFVQLVASNQGNTIKSALHSGLADQGKWVHTVFFLHATLWWSLARGMQLKPKGFVMFCFGSIFGVGFLVDLLTCLATVSRGSLIPLFVGVIIIYLNERVKHNDFSLKKLIFIVAATAVSLVSLFLAFAYFRGSATDSALVAGLLGYTITSYNRLAALLGGTMHFAYPKTGVYLFPMLLENGNLLHFFGLQESYGWPNYYLNWLSEFSSVYAAGLNKAFIWAGAFGYIYSDIGWFAPLYFLLMGAISGYFWRMFKTSRTLGLVLYPMFAFWILFWFGSNAIFTQVSLDYAQVAVCLVVYDRLLLRHTGPSRSKPLQLPVFGSRDAGAVSPSEAA